MGWDWLIPLVMGLATAGIFILKSLFGTSKPQETTVEHPKPEVEVTDGKTDKERLDDLGL